MVNTLSYQMYEAGHRRSVAEQRAADARAGQAAAARRDLRLLLGQALRLRRRARPAVRTLSRVW